MGDPQCFAGGKHVRGCAKVTIVLARGRTLLNHIKVSQHIPLRPLVDHREFHSSPCVDATTECWRDAPELQHKIFPTLHAAKRCMGDSETAEHCERSSDQMSFAQSFSACYFHHTCTQSLPASGVADWEHHCAATRSQDKITSQTLRFSLA